MDSLGQQIQRYQKDSYYLENHLKLVDRITKEIKEDSLIDFA